MVVVGFVAVVVFAERGMLWECSLLDGTAKEKKKSSINTNDNYVSSKFIKYNKKKTKKGTQLSR